MNLIKFVTNCKWERLKPVFSDGILLSTRLFFCLFNCMLRLYLPLGPTGFYLRLAEVRELYRDAHTFQALFLRKAAIVHYLFVCESFSKIPLKYNEVCGCNVVKLER